MLKIIFYNYTLVLKTKTENKTQTELNSDSFKGNVTNRWKETFLNITDHIFFFQVIFDGAFSAYLMFPLNMVFLPRGYFNL